MVYGINSNLGAQNVGVIKTPYKVKPPVKPQPKVTNPIDQSTMRGLEALGIYNMTMITNQNDFNHVPATFIVNPGTKMEDIDGEKSYKPNGDLDYITEDKGDVEIKYIPSEDKPEEVGIVEVRNINTGNLEKTQENYYDDGKYVHSNVAEYLNDANDTVFFSGMDEDGNIDFVDKIVTLPNGIRKTISKQNYDAEPRYGIYASSIDGKSWMDVNFDSSQNIKDIRVGKKLGDLQVSKNYILNKGAVIGYSANMEKTIPNYMEREILADKDIQPAAYTTKDVLEAEGHSANGEIQYYNNGKMKSVTVKDENGDDLVYSYNGDGTLREFKEKFAKVEFGPKGSLTVTEYLEDGAEKRTYYGKDKAVDVVYKNGEVEKTMAYDKNLKPEFYLEHQGGKMVKRASFSEEGYLKDN